MMLPSRPFVLSILLLFSGFTISQSQPGTISPSPHPTKRELERYTWKVAPLTKNDLKAAQAMDRILGEFQRAKTRKQEQAILAKYLRKTYSNPLQTTEALYAGFYYGSKNRVILSLGEEPTVTGKSFEAAFLAHLALANPTVIEHAKALVLIRSSEHFLVVPPQTVRSIYRLFKNDIHSSRLLSAYEVSLELNDKQNRLALYKEVKDLYDSFPKGLTYLHSSDSRNSRAKLNIYLMLIANRLYRHCNVSWGREAAIRHYDDLMKFENPDMDTKRAQVRARELRARFKF